MTTIQNQKFGVEVELTGITKKKAARVIAQHLGGTAEFVGTVYNTSAITAPDGRVWKCMGDSSIRTERMENGEMVRANGDYSCEVVTPILTYDDLEDLQNIIQKLVDNGAVANESCGIHVHVNGTPHSPESLTRLLNFATGRQDLFYEALEIGDRANRWCHKISPKLMKAMKKAGDKSTAEQIWYSSANDGYTGGIDHQHYNTTRYHGINLHAFFTKGTVEFRLFNGTTDTNKIKAYIQFCLAMSAWAVNTPDRKLYFKSCAEYQPEQKAALMNRVLTHRLGMKGNEFKTARTVLTSAFTA